jgi:hypothetical protein
MGLFIFLPSILKELAHSVNLKKMYKYFYKVLHKNTTLIVICQGSHIFPRKINNRVIYIPQLKQV